MIIMNNLLRDDCLELIPATQTMIEFELSDISKVFEILDVEAPPSWPPELNDEDSFRYFLNQLSENPEAKTWGAHYAIEFSQGRKLIGNGGFIAPPDESGRVEIGYSILPNYRRQGLATRLIALLVKRAFWDKRMSHVWAQTYPHLIGSIGVLEKNGCKFDNEKEDGTIAFRLNR